MKELVALALAALAGQEKPAFSFRDVTEEAGLLPDVAGIRGHAAGWGDADGDGGIDLYVGTFRAEGSKANLFFRNAGGKFRLDDQESLRLSTRSNSALFCDFDNDGRLDLFLASWWPEAPSLLLRNETAGDAGLDVRVEGVPGVNRLGIGAQVRAYAAGRLGDPAALLGAREIAVGYGYTSGQPAAAHLGLGKETACDLEVLLPHGKGRIVRRGVPAGRITIAGP